MLKGFEQKIKISLDDKPVAPVSSVLMSALSKFSLLMMQKKSPVLKKSLIVSDACHVIIYVLLLY
jgi:hypothetical protein